MPSAADDLESQRVERLRALMVLNTDQEPIFETLAALASSLCGTPIALISLVDTDRQWFKAGVGLAGVTQTPRSIAFCDHAIRGPDLMEVPDAKQDARFSTNPLVTEDPHIRFYAGAPLVMATGERVGTLCVLDRQPRELDMAQRKSLSRLAELTVQALELRERSIRQSLAVRHEHERTVIESERRFRAILDAQSELVSQSTEDGQLVYVNPAYAHFFGLSVSELVGSNLYDQVLPSERTQVRAHIAEVFTTGKVMSAENRMVSPGNQDRWVSWTNTRQVTDSGQVLLHSTGRDVTARVQAQRALAHSEALLDKTGRAAGVGGWELDLASGELTWTAETRRIHEVDADFSPTLERALDFYTSASRSMVEHAVQEGLSQGTPWDLELELVTARGRKIWARAVGEVEFALGRAVRMFGAFQDITERRAAEQVRREIADIFDNSSDLILQADRERRLRYMNPAAARVLLAREWRGDAEPEVFVRDLLPEVTRQRFVDVILPALHGQGVWVGQSVIFDAHRREIPVSHMVIAHRDAQGGIERFSIIWRDISELVQAQQERERQTLTLRSVTDAIPASVAVVGRDGRYVMANPAFVRSLALNVSDIVGRTAREVLGEREFDARMPWIRQAMAGEGVRFERADLDAGAERHVSYDYLPLRTAAGELDGFVVVGQDVTHVKREQERLHLLSQTDALTRLLNRAGFDQHIRNHFDPVTTEPIAILYCDLDRFKAVNDTHGHAAGDELLKLVARRLVRLVRPSDTVARLGGDEFALILPGMRQAADADRVGQSIVHALQQAFRVSEGLEVQIGCSIGIAMCEAGAGDPIEALKRADELLYRAKRAGRGCVRLG